MRLLARKRAVIRVELTAGALLLLFASGCQVDVGGQTLPSPWYLTDDVQYFPAGPEFKLSREAAAIQEAKARDLRRRNNLPPAVVAPMPSVTPAPEGVGLPMPGIAPPVGPDGIAVPPAGIVPPAANPRAPDMVPEGAPPEEALDPFE